MDYSKKQKQLDVKKWIDSEISGYDTCGTYSYCSSCNKSEAYPCACAYEIHSVISKLSKEAKTTTTKKTKPKTNSTDKKSTSTAKKSTSSKKSIKSVAEVC